MVEFYDQKVTTRNVIVPNELYTYFYKTCDDLTGIEECYELPSIEQFETFDLENKEISEIKDILNLCCESLNNNECDKIDIVEEF